MSLEDRKIVITGAAGGLGSAVALTCAERGAQLLLVDKDAKGLDSLCDSVEEHGGQPPGYCEMDLATATPGSIGELISDFRSRHGEVDGLVHCAAQFNGLQPLDQISGDQWLRDMQVNLNVPWLFTVCCLESLKSSPAGRIVFVLDGAVTSGLAYWGAYGVSKAGLRALAGSFAEELENTNCKVYAVDPGPMRTALRAAAWLGEDPSTPPVPGHAAELIAQLLDKDSAEAPVFHTMKPA